MSKRDKYFEKKNVPVVQHQNKFSRFEGQLVVLRCLKVVQRTHFPDLLPSSAAGVVCSVRGGGQGSQVSLLFLLL